MVMSKTANIKMICLTGMFMALICIATLFFKVPIPLGYAHLGNGFIFLAGAFLANPYALIAAGVGSALADLLGGYAEWILPTLIIKCIMGAVIAGIAAKEVVVSSCAVLFGIGNITSQAGMEGLATLLGTMGFGVRNAYAMMVFCLLYVPCMATLATIKRETESWKWTAAMVGFQLAVAWVMAFLVYHVGGILV